MNTYLNEIMEGLSAKVFRTYNASRTLQEQLDKMTNCKFKIKKKKQKKMFLLGNKIKGNLFLIEKKTAKDDVNDKILSYNRANRAVAILCNHQRAVPKTFAKSMENMQQKLNAKKEQIEQAEIDLKKAKTDLKNLKTVAAKK